MKIASANAKLSYCTDLAHGGFKTMLSGPRLKKVCAPLVYAVVFVCAYSVFLLQV